MKKKFKAYVIIWLSVFAFFISAAAESNESFSWYCKRNSEHLQPTLDSQINFIEECSGYYVDKNCDKQGEKIIYLTFDAGYENGNVAKILDVLKEENVSGSFFILENLLTNHSALVKRMVDDGNLVCNHTATHKDVSKVTYDELKYELKKMETLYREKIGGELPKYFRPPEGRFSHESLKNTASLGYKTIFWSFAYADWDNNHQMDPEKAFEKVMANIHNGEIMLLHPTSATNVKILPRIIKELKKQGYSFKTLEYL